MKLRATALVSLVASALAAQAQAPAEPAEIERATLGERLGWNARERAAAGAEALERGDAAAGRQALDRALRLRPDDVTSRYNAGTGRLAEGDPSALPLLEQAAREAPPALAPSAWYNLGDARFGGKDFRGAVQAFVEALKLDPAHAGAKRNLELALRALQREQQEQQRRQSREEPQNPEQSDDAAKQEPSSGEDRRDGGSPDDRDPRAGSNDEQRSGSPNEPGSKEKAEPGEESEQPTRFREQPDMTAEQAAALLRAVENLERQQRKERARKAAAAARAQVEVDW